MARLADVLCGEHLGQGSCVQRNAECPSGGNLDERRGTSVRCRRQYLDGDPQIVEEIPDATIGTWGAPAYWNGNLYWGGSNDRLKAFSFDRTTGKISTTPTSESTNKFAYPSPTPSVSANGATAGIVWTLDASAFASTGAAGEKCQILYAYDATNLATTLYSSSQAANNRDVPGSAVSRVRLSC